MTELLKIIISILIAPIFIIIGFGIIIYIIHETIWNYKKRKSEIE